MKPPASNTGRSAAALGLRSAADTRPGHAQTSDRRLTRPASGFLAFRRVCDALTCRDAAMCVQIRLSAAERRITNQGQSLKEDGYTCLTGPQPATTAPAPAATTSTITVTQIRSYATDSDHPTAAAPVPSEARGVSARVAHDYAVIYSTVA